VLRVREPAQRISSRYRHRFEIETGDRPMAPVQARTTSPNPALRFLLMGIALLIVNM